MNRIRKIAAIGAIVVGVAMLIGALAEPVEAQAALPFKAFGSGLTPGSVVTAWKGTANVGTTTVDANGNWQITIEPTAAANGDVINFKINGATAVQTIVFQSGLFTPPPGLALTLAAGGGTPAPAPAPTGNAGLAGATPQTSALLMLILGLAAATLVVGGRRMTHAR
jgi:hypothetical protein